MRHNNVPLAVYVDANTPLHRLSPSWKILFLLIFVVITSCFIHTLPYAAAALLVSLCCYVVARIPVKIAAAQLWPPLVILIPLSAFQWWTHGFNFAAVKFLTILATMMLAFLLTLTSTVGEILDSVEASLQPLQRYGLPVEIITLTMSLTIRLIPLMFATVYEVLDARLARGAACSPTAFGTPVIIRSIRRAQALGEALTARGVGD